MSTISQISPKRDYQQTNLIAFLYFMKGPLGWLPSTISTKLTGIKKAIEHLHLSSTIKLMGLKKLKS